MGRGGAGEGINPPERRSAAVKQLEVATRAGHRAMRKGVRRWQGSTAAVADEALAERSSRWMTGSPAREPSRLRADRQSRGSGETAGRVAGSKSGAPRAVVAPGAIPAGSKATLGWTAPCSAHRGPLAGAAAWGSRSQTWESAKAASSRPSWDPTPETNRRCHRFTGGGGRRQAGHETWAA